MKRWFAALAQAFMLMVVIVGVLGLLDVIAPVAQQASTTEWRWALIGGVVGWGVLGTIFHRLEDPEEL